MFNKKTIRDIDVKGKRVLVRVDFNVPLKDGKVTDDTRIQAELPTLEYLLKQGAALILCSHLGRPKDGQRQAEFSMKPVADHLAKVMGRKVLFCGECIGPVAEDAAKKLKPGDILVLENTRFYPGETKNDPEMARQLAALADIMLMMLLGRLIGRTPPPKGWLIFYPAVAGFLMEKEIRYLGQAVSAPEKPFVVILGGAKIVDKIGVIRNLLTKADQVLIGGGMANTFLKAQGFEMGDSLVDVEALDTAKELLSSPQGSRLLLPVDVVIADRFDDQAASKVMKVGAVPAGWRILDIGPETIKIFGDAIQKAKTVVWNGPMGVFEFPHFAVGTFGVAKAVAASQATTIIGGGDSVAAINQSGLADKITHISTGGGASLEMLEGLVLPGLAALQDK